MGEYIDIQSRGGGSFAAYRATPPRGRGPGVVLLHEIFGITEFVRQKADELAAEGYVVVAPDLFWRHAPRVELGENGSDLQRAFELFQALDIDLAVQDAADTANALRAMDEHIGKVGSVGYCIGGRLAALAIGPAELDCAVAYYPVQLDQHLPELEKVAVPFMVHLAGEDEHSTAEQLDHIMSAADNHEAMVAHLYAGVGHPFANRYRRGFDARATDIADARTLQVLRGAMGPHHDLSALWDEHLGHEFAGKDVAATMATMVAQPYVNHIPTMTGGVGYDMLARFYKYHFVDDNPEQQIIPISRTVGSNRVVDEFVACFTHDREIPWMLPGVAPTGKWVEVPIVAIVGFSGGKLRHEHIYWDQASVLVQLGLLDPAGLPVAGVEVARKVVDRTLPSNGLMPGWAASENLPVP